MSAAARSLSLFTLVGCQFLSTGTGVFEAVIERNTVIPTRKSKRFPVPLSAVPAGAVATSVLLNLSLLEGASPGVPIARCRSVPPPLASPSVASARKNLICPLFSVRLLGVMTVEIALPPPPQQLDVEMVAELDANGRLAFWVWADGVQRQHYSVPDSAGRCKACVCNY